MGTLEQNIYRPFIIAKGKSMIQSGWLKDDGSRHAKNGLDHHWQQSRQYIQHGQYEQAWFELYAIQSMIDVMLRELQQLREEKE